MTVLDNRVMTITGLWNRNRNQNHNFSKVGIGTGTVKNSYGSTTLDTNKVKLGQILYICIRIFCERTYKNSYTLHQISALYYLYSVLLLTG
jgi:hypothetical protein